MTIEADYRLPRTVTPVRYELELTPDLGGGTFSGAETVEVVVETPVDRLVVNAVGLEVTDAVLTPAGGGECLPCSVDLDTERERLAFVRGRGIPTGRWLLSCRFTGRLGDDLRGFYRSTYRGDRGEQKAMATTQFEATDARRAFPCWDEPDRKAVFSVSLVVPAGWTAVSNGAEIGREPHGDGRVRVRFADTMKMSTYLVAFVVGELAATDPIDVDGVPLRVLHVPGKEDLTAFALEIGAFALRYFGDYYGIPYPGGKMDMIAIPDFAWGAMENLGAVTYRETALLVDPARATRAELVRVADVVAHELAHMWFGDLVTMKWWNGIWLNEAFATFMEMKCVDAFRPEWKRWLTFASGRAHAMEIDGLASTRTVEFPVGSPDEANEMFDTLTYEKGAAVLRMLEQYLGEETFRDGVRGYLDAHAYGNTVTADLWGAFEGVSGEPVGAIMETWIFQGGYPKVTVEAVEGGARLTQTPFRYLGQGEGRWRVPVLYRVGEQTGRVLLEDPVVVEAGARPNGGGHGFYRVVTAGPPIWDDLAPPERYAALSDGWALTLSGDRPASDFLARLDRLADECEPAVWEVALSGLDELHRVAASAGRVRLAGLIREVVGPVAARLGWDPKEDETDLTRQLRGRLLRVLGSLGADEATRSEARKRFGGALLGDGGGFDADVADAVVGIVASTGDRGVFEGLMGAHARAQRPQDVVRYLRAAAAVPDHAAARELLDRVLSGGIRSQDAFWLVAAMLGHRDIGPSTWEEVKGCWEALLSVLPPQSGRRLLDGIPYRSEPEVAADIECWLVDHPIAGAERTVAQQLERLRVRVALREREGGRLGT